MIVSLSQESVKRSFKFGTVWCIIFFTTEILKNHIVWFCHIISLYIYNIYRGQWRRHGGGGGEEGRWGNCPPYNFFFVLLLSSVVGHGHDSTPTPLWNVLGKNLKSGGGGEMCRSPPPPPPPAPPPTPPHPLSDFSGLAQNVMARAAVARLLAILPPPPTHKQTPWRRPCKGGTTGVTPQTKKLTNYWLTMVFYPFLYQNASK